MSAILYFDGACRGNPGPMGIGYIIARDGRPPLEAWGRLREKGTNNIAEWCALIYGLEEAARLGIQTLKVRGDSQLVVRQMTGEYRVKKPHLLPLYNRATRLSQKFIEISFTSIAREENIRADGLSNKGLDDPMAQRFEVPVR